MTAADTLPEAPQRTVDRPGVYRDIPIDAYHADPGSLSSSEARKLLPPSCPALFRHEKDNPPASTPTFDYGNAAHRLVLGDGPEIAVIDADDWRTNAAKQAKAEAYEAGRIPMLRADYDAVQAMAAALRRHPLAAMLLDGGEPEVSLFWKDEPTGVRRRARLDWLPERTTSRLIIPDYKTARNADPERFAKSAVDYGYHQQADWYVDAARSVGLGGDDTVFLFVVQEKQPPYLVSVVQLDAEAMRIGRILNRRAIDLYAECTSTGVWPGYSDDVAHVSLPYWYERTFEGETS